MMNLRGRMKEIGSEWSDVGFQEDKDFGEELNFVEAEKTWLSREIEVLTRTYAKDSNKLEIELEGLKCSMDLTVLLLLELENEVKKKKLILKSLEDLDGICKWFDALEQIEDILTGVKVIALEENCIRFSWQTYIPNLESVLSQQNIEAVNVPFEVKHELLIEFVKGTKDQKNVEIFPNDACINNISNAAKDFRHSFEYFDKDEAMVAYLAGGVDSFVKVSQGWPITNSPLKLISLKSSDRYTKGIPSSVLSKAKEMVNSLAMHVCQSLSSFVDAVEKKITEQMQLELNSDDTLKKDQ